MRADYGTGPAGLDALNDVAIASPAVGQRLEFDGTTWVNATPAQGPQTAYKSTATNRNTTVAADPDLVLPVEASSVYAVELMLDVEVTTANTIKIGFAFPSGAILSWAGNDDLQRNLNPTTTVNLTITAGGGIQHLKGSLYTLANAGNLTLYWAATSGSLPLQPGSWMRLTKLN
jgi:hypothetical protein